MTNQRYQISLACLLVCVGLFLSGIAIVQSGIHYQRLSLIGIAAIAITMSVLAPLLHCLGQAVRASWLCAFFFGCIVAGLLWLVLYVPPDHRLPRCVMAFQRAGGTVTRNLDTSELTVDATSWSGSTNLLHAVLTTLPAERRITLRMTVAQIKDSDTHDLLTLLDELPVRLEISNASSRSPLVND